MVHIAYGVCREQACWSVYSSSNSRAGLANPSGYRAQVWAGTPFGGCRQVLRQNAAHARHGLPREPWMQPLDIAGRTLAMIF